MRLRLPARGLLIYTAAVVAALGGAAMAVLTPHATAGAVSPLVIAVGLGGLVLAGPRLTVGEVTWLTITAWTGSAVAALALTGVAVSLLGFRLSISTVGLGYLSWITAISIGHLVITSAGQRDRPPHGVIVPSMPGHRVATGLAYLVASGIPACIVVFLLLGAQPKEGPTVGVWILPAAGGVAGVLTVRPGASFDVVAGVEVRNAEGRRVELVVDLAGVTSIDRSFAASDTPAQSTTSVLVPSDASGSVAVIARAHFIGEPGSEVTAVLHLVITP